MYALTRRASNGNFDFGQRGAFQHKFSLRGLRKIGPIPGTAKAGGGETRSRTASKLGSFPVSLSRVRAVSTSDSEVLAARCKTRTYSRSARTELACPS